VQRHRTSKRELDEIRAVIARALADARIEALSVDRRFATAYNAALQRASMAVACAGYRVTAKTGHHRVTIDAVTLAVGSAAKPFAAYLETCRRKRNAIDYTRAHVAGDSEATEIVTMASAFDQLVENWIASKFAKLKRQQVSSEDPMPFKSQAQRRKFAQLLVDGKISNETFEEWNRETGRKKLPERVGTKAKTRTKSGGATKRRRSTKRR